MEGETENAVRSRQRLVTALARFAERYLSVRSDDPALRREGRALILVVTALTLVTLAQALFFPIRELFRPGSNGAGDWQFVRDLGLFIAAMPGIIALAKLGRVRLGSIIVLLGTTFFATINSAWSFDLWGHQTMAALVFMIAAAGLLLGRGGALIAAVAISALEVALAALLATRIGSAFVAGMILLNLLMAAAIEFVWMYYARLEHTRNRLETILHSSPDAIMLLRLDGTIEQVNRAFCEMFACEDGPGAQERPSDLVEPEHAAALGAALRRTLDEGQTQRLEVVARRRDGSTFDADIALDVIREAGEVTGVIGCLRDISALKEVHRMRNRFISTVSHELRTPITSIKLYHDLLALQPEQFPTYIKAVQRETRRLEQIVNDLLALPRAEQSTPTIQMLPVDINDLAREYVTDRLVLAKNQDIALTFVEQPDLPPMQGDPAKLGQVLSNLLSNALSYTPAGGQVTVEAISEEWKDGALWVGFSVTDTGPGIPAEEQNTVFKHFFRGKAALESGAPGTGLGLAIARQIVEAHDGRIEVVSDSPAGQGVTFRAIFPVETSEK
jgi:PAS domain S-box-containing protein